MPMLTAFRLFVENGNIEEVTQAMYDHDQDIGYILKSDGTTKDIAKWYEYQTDMEVVSKQFPNATLILCGVGEEQGDIWREYFRNGKMQRRASAKKKIVFVFEDTQEVDENEFFVFD